MVNVSVMKLSMGDKKIISYLALFGHYASPEEIGNNVAGSIKCKMNGVKKVRRNARWARMKCRRLLQRGVLESDGNGNFRIH